MKGLTKDLKAEAIKKWSNYLTENEIPNDIWNTCGICSAATQGKGDVNARSCSYCDLNKVIYSCVPICDGSLATLSIARKARNSSSLKEFKVYARIVLDAIEMLEVEDVD